MVINTKGNTFNFLDRSGTVSQYFSDMRNLKPLSEEEQTEYMLIIKDEKTDDELRTYAKQRIAETHQGLIASAARQYAPNNKFLDCVNEGTIGLYEAIENYDVEMGVKFSTYAAHYIRRAITQYLRDKEPAIQKTNISKTFHTVAQARNEFMQREEREPSMDELAELLSEKYKVDVKDVSDITDMRLISIDETVSDNEDEVKVGDMELFNDYSASQNDYETEVNSDYNKELISSLLDILNERDKKIITMFFGIGYFREYNPTEISEEIGMSTERVRQLQKEIVAKLQDEFAKRSKML